MKKIKSTLLGVSLILVLMMLALSTWGVVVMIRPLPLTTVSVHLTIPSGTSVRGIAQLLLDAGLLSEPYSFLLWVELTGDARLLQAGDYVFSGPMQMSELISQLKRGKFVAEKLQLTEGKTFAEFRALINQLSIIKHETVDWSEAELMQHLNAEAISPEGWFFPDTYFIDAQTSDLDLYRQAYQQMQKRLQQAWSSRATHLPYTQPYQALIMASLIEKETGNRDERALIAGVFLNRLRLGMRLQTDPTVIYGIGSSFDGNLTRQHLLTDTPYNTYTRAGLPPTPIAMPGQASIEAALHPANTNALYFVADGRGGHVFSATLEAHNRAVHRYQRQQK